MVYSKANADLAAGMGSPEGVQIALEAWSAAKDRAESLASSLDLTTAQAEELNKAFDAMRGAKTMQEINDRATTALQVLRDMFPAGEALPPAFAAAATALQEVERQSATGLLTLKKMPGALVETTGAADDFGKALIVALDTAVILSGAGPQSGWLSGAIGDVDVLIGRLWDAVTASRSISPLQAYNNREDAMAKGGLGRGQTPSSQGPVFHRADGTVFDPNPKSSGSGSSGGGGGTSSNPLSDLSAQAQKAMADMDLAIAAINEKVKVGLLSTAEAGDAITSAREKAANDIAMLIAELDRLGPAGKAAADALRISLTTMTADLQGPINDLAKSLSEGLTDPLKDFMKGTKTASEAFQAMGDNIISKLIDIAMQQAQMEFFTPLISGLFGGMGGGGLGGSIMSAFGLAHGGMVSGPGTGTSDSIPARLSNGEFVVNAAATAKNKSLLRAINAGQMTPVLRTFSKVAASSNMMSSVNS